MNNTNDPSSTRPGSIRHSRVPGFTRTVLMLALAAGLAGCAGGDKSLGTADTGPRGKSRPITEVKEREAAAIEARRLAAEKARAGAAPAEGNASIPEGDQALAEWLKRAEDDGLVKANPSKKPGTARKPASAPAVGASDHGAPVENTGANEANASGEANEATAFLNNASTTTPSGVTEPAASNANESHTVTSNVPAALPTVSATDAAIVDSTVSSSRPLAALVKLHAAKAAGDSRVSDAEIKALEKSLSPAEAEFYSAWKALQASVAAGADSSADVAAMKRAASAFAQATRGWAELRVPKAVLCTRVEGFGMYTELPRRGSVGRATGGAAGGAGGISGAVNAEELPAYTFIAGRKNKFIVYCEIDGFASRPSSASGRPGFEVEISQDLTLFAPGSGGGFTTSGAIVGAGRDVIAWRKPDQRVKDFSRNQRRDFFMVQIVELPEALTVGAYSLKVRVKDLASDGNAEAEAVIPIDVVADSSALGR
jgi:hypothetical protein